MKKRNSKKNLHFLMERHLDQSTTLPIHIHGIDPDTKEHSRFAIYQPSGQKIILIIKQR